MLPSSHPVLPSNAPPYAHTHPYYPVHTTTAAIEGDGDEVFSDAASNDDFAAYGEPGAIRGSYATPTQRGSRLSRLSAPTAHRTQSSKTPYRSSSRHAHHERLRALTVDPSSTFVATYKDRQTGRVFERRERIREAILPEEYEDYVAWRDDDQSVGADAEQRRKKQYLARPRKELSKKEGQEGEEVWSRELDDAYQTAIRRVPPLLGKKKLKVPNGRGGYSLYGRNMLISRVIFLLTGQTRLRKQISSHNQVMWNFPRKLSYARYAASLDTGKKNSRYVRVYDTSQLMWDEENAQVVVLGRGAQTGPSASRLTSQREPLFETSLLQSSPARPLGPRKPAMVHSVDFSMSRYAPTSEDPYLRNKPEHRYTTLQSAMGARPQAFEDFQDWIKQYPELAARQSRNELHDADVVLFESTFSIGKPPRSGARLYTTYDMEIHCEENVREWTMNTTFYEGKGMTKIESSEKSIKSRKKSVNRTQLIDMPFGSLRWVEILTRIMQQKASVAWAEEERIERSGHGRCPGSCEECQRLRQQAQMKIDSSEQQLSDHILRDTAITQELYMAGDEGRKKCAAIFLWRFRRAVPGEAATTTWKRLSPPLSSNASPSMLPSFQQSSEMQWLETTGEEDADGQSEQMADIQRQSQVCVSYGANYASSAAQYLNNASGFHDVANLAPSASNVARGSQDSGYWSHEDQCYVPTITVRRDATNARMFSLQTDPSLTESTRSGFGYHSSTNASSGNFNFSDINYLPSTSDATAHEMLSLDQYSASANTEAEASDVYSNLLTDPRLLSFGESQLHFQPQQTLHRSPIEASSSVASQSDLQGNASGVQHLHKPSPDPQCSNTGTGFSTELRRILQQQRNAHPPQFMHAHSLSNATSTATGSGVPLLSGHEETIRSSSRSAVATPAPQDGDDGQATGEIGVCLDPLVLGQWSTNDSVEALLQLSADEYESCYHQHGRVGFSSNEGFGEVGREQLVPDIGAVSGQSTQEQGMAGIEVSRARAQQAGRVLRAVLSNDHYAEDSEHTRIGTGGDDFSATVRVGTGR